jgi:hypothetical protein
MNIRITKLYQDASYSMLEVAFNSDPRGAQMIREIAEATGCTFERPPANRHALRELHLARVGDRARLDEAYRTAGVVAEKYGPVHDSQKDMHGPNDRAADRGGV